MCVRALLLLLLLLLLVLAPLRHIPLFLSHQLFLCIISPQQPHLRLFLKMPRINP